MNKHIIQLTKEKFIKEYADNREKMSMEQSLSEIYDKYLNNIVESQKRQAIKAVENGRVQSDDFNTKPFAGENQPVGPEEQALKDFCEKLMADNQQCFAMVWKVNGGEDVTPAIHFMYMSSDGYTHREYYELGVGDKLEASCRSILQTLKSRQEEGVIPDAKKG